MTSAVLVLPDAWRDAGNALSAAMGWGPSSYTVPLSPTGALPATHWGCRPEVYPAYDAMIKDPPEMALPVLAVLISDYKETDDPAGHFREVIAAHNLYIVEPPS